MKHKEVDKYDCFNSLQVGYKPAYMGVHITPVTSFNSLQVGYKQDAEKFAQLIAEAGFNSLQVGYKLETETFFPSGIKLFQFLIGWLQTSLLELPVKWIGQFQFLIGWLQTIQRKKSQVWEALLFQFLIGWLQTRRVIQNLYEKKPFQFLIGWLQTRDENGGMTEIAWFQFLIGWLQTVSISTGYRVKYQFQFLIGWLQTEIEGALNPEVFESFNSLQVGYKLPGKGWIISPDHCFNSLQVGYKRMFLIRRYRQLKQVSIPYRLATNKTTWMTMQRILKFQFLIGWLQTF